MWLTPRFFLDNDFKYSLLNTTYTFNLNIINSEENYIFDDNKRNLLFFENESTKAYTSLCMNGRIETENVYYQPISTRMAKNFAVLHLTNPTEANYL